MDRDVEASSKEISEEFTIIDVKSLTPKVSFPANSSSLPKTREEILKEVETSVNVKLLPFSSQNHQDSPFPVSIYKVPKKLSRANEDAFAPRLVSVGPYHHGTSNLQAMEQYKLRCLNRFNAKHKGAINTIISEIMAKEALIRDCYEDKFANISSGQFVEMLMLDAIFILELTLSESSAKEKIFEEWMPSEILHDMLLLENQIPWFVLSLCLRHAQPKENIVLPVEKRVKHFFELLAAVIKYFQMVGITCPPEVLLTQTIHSHFVEMLGTSLLPKPQRRKPSRLGNPELTRSATELREAGVKFTAGKGKSLLEIDYSEGELTIPQLAVNEWTETFFRNQIAFEHCGRRGRDKVVTSYVIFMDSLIDTSADVNLLVKCGVLKNSLSDSQQVADLFNNLHKETLIDAKSFYYAKHCEDLNQYSRDFWYQWKAKLLRWKRMLGSDDYFGNPWTTISVIAACILLALTIIQTVCAITAL